MPIFNLRRKFVSIVIASSLWCGGLAVCVAQSAPDRVANSMTFPVFSLNPAPVPGATIAVVGQPGQATWYFWASANYQLGNVVSALGSIQNAPNTLSGQNYVTIFPNQYPSGVTNVDILATHTPVAPSGACNCAVATHLTAGGANFQSNSLSSYTVSILNPSAFNLTLKNIVVGSGSTHLQLLNALTGALVADLSAAGPTIEFENNGQDNLSQTVLDLRDGQAGGPGAGIVYVHPNNVVGGSIALDLIVGGGSGGLVNDLVFVNSFFNLQPTAGGLSFDSTTNTLTGGSFRPQTVLVGSLPAAAGSVGKLINVSDSTAISAEGQTCAGGSSGKALAYSNGTGWKCF